MNSASLKYKSFFYSLAIHLVLGLIVLSLYLKEDEKHEVYTLINLKNLKICVPSVCEPLAKEIIQAKKIPREKKQKTVKKVSKPQKKPVPVKMVIPLKAEPVAEVLFLEVEAVPPSQDTKENLEVQEEVVAEMEVQVKESTPVVAVSEPSISYEAQYMQDNIALINALIKKNLSYPRLAKKRGLQGKAMVSFTLNKEGEVLDIEALGTLSSILKKSAIKTVQKASSAFPHPSEVLALRIPIVYKLH